MFIPTETLDPLSAYKLLVGAIVPRPIAWVTTISSAGVINAAPFSAFTFVCYAPPMIAISVGRKGDEIKDTARNIQDSRQFVVNIGSDSHLDQLHQTSAEYPAEVSEVDALGLETMASRFVSVPRLAAAPVSMECRLHDIIEFGRLKTQLIVGEVVAFHIRDDLYSAGKIDSIGMRPIARLGGPRYMTAGETITKTPIKASFG